MKTQAALDNFLQSCIARELSPITIGFYRNKLGRFARSYPKLPRKPAPIEEFLASIQGVPETKHAYYRALKVLYRFLRKRYRLPNPIDLIDPPRCPKKIMATLEPQDLMRLLNSASTLRNRTILTLFVDTGMRSTELAGLRKQDIKAETVTIRGKTGEREVPISEDTRRLLLALITHDHSTDEYVFHRRKGKLPINRKSIYTMINAHMKKAGIQGPKLGGHRIRHAFGKNYLVEGGDLRSLQELMGHANITTTEKYASLNLTDIVKKHHQFTPLRAAHAAAQETLFAAEALKEAEEILQKGGKT